MRTERRGQDDAAPDAGGPGGVGRRHRREAGGLTVGYLPQDGLEHRGRTVFEEAASAFAPLLAMKAEMHELEQRLVSSVPQDEQMRCSIATASCRTASASLKATASTCASRPCCAGSDSRPKISTRPAETFSGGWQMRIALAEAAAGPSGPAAARRADQPPGSRGAQLAGELSPRVSARRHPRLARPLLPRCGRHQITDLNLRTLTDYSATTATTSSSAMRVIERLRRRRREQDEEVARVKMFIDRFRYQATKAAQVQSRIKLLEKVVPIEVPPERKRMHFRFPACAKSGRTVIELKHVRKAYGALVVFDEVVLHIERGDRIALVGPNGAGKSTLMRMLSGEEAPDRGERHVGHQVVMRVLRAGRSHASRAHADGV